MFISEEEVKTLITKEIQETSKQLLSLNSTCQSMSLCDAIHFTRRYDSQSYTLELNLKPKVFYN